MLNYGLKSNARHQIVLSASNSKTLHFRQWSAAAGRWLWVGFYPPEGAPIMVDYQWFVRLNEVNEYG